MNSADERAAIVALPRQWPCDLKAALNQAAIMFRQQAVSLRHNRDGKMDKHLRKGMAASYADWARLIEQHVAHLNQGKQEADD